MTEGQANIDVGVSLADSDCDIGFELSYMYESARDIGAKFSSILRQARQLKTRLLDEQKERELLTAQHQQQLSKSLKSSEKLRNKLLQLGDKLRRSQADNKSMRKQIQHLGNDLQKAREELDTVDLLRCDICMHSFKDVMIPCGHCFCRECLTLWLGNSGKDCPTCRQSVAQGDIRALYIEPDNRTTGGREGDENVTGVISLASDSE